MKIDRESSMFQILASLNAAHSNVIIRNAMNGFIKRIGNSDNQIILCTLQSNFYSHSALVQHWYKCLETMYL